MTVIETPKHEIEIDIPLAARVCSISSPRSDRGSGTGRNRIEGQRLSALLTDGEAGEWRRFLRSWSARAKFVHRCGA
jgi:hypothetical protein